jgi:hypothetical protein
MSTGAKTKPAAQPVERLRAYDLTDEDPYLLTGSTCLINSRESTPGGRNTDNGDQ